jgi:hypothetical protein
MQSFSCSTETAENHFSTAVLMSLVSALSVERPTSKVSVNPGEAQTARLSEVVGLGHVYLTAIELQEWCNYYRQSFDHVTLDQRARFPEGVLQHLSQFSDRLLRILGGDWQ